MFDGFGGGTSFSRSPHQSVVMLEEREQQPNEATTAGEAAPMGSQDAWLGAVTLEDQPGETLAAGLLLSTVGDLMTAQGVPPKR